MLYNTALSQHFASQLSSVQFQHVKAQELSARQKQEETKRNSTFIYFQTKVLKIPKTIYSVKMPDKHVRSDIVEGSHRLLVSLCG